MKHRRSIAYKNRGLALLAGLCLGLVLPLYALPFAAFGSLTLALLFAAGSAVAGVAVSLLSWRLGSRAFSGTAARVNSVMARLARGEEVDIGEIGTDSTGEIGELVGNFRKVLALFRDTLGILRDTATSAVSMSSKVGSCVNETMEGTTILFRTISLINDAVTELDRQNSLMEAGFDKLNRSTLLSMASIIELYTSINDFGKTIFDQTESLNHLIETLKGIELHIGSDSDTAGHPTLTGLSTDLGNRVQDTIDTSLAVFNGIKSNLDEIDGIAERTNILSINAGIEAARLGQSGSGFRIIAGNIKDLAGEVHLLTERIDAEMAEGERKIAAVTGGLGKAIGAQETIIGAIKGSIDSLSERDSNVTRQMVRMEEDREQIDTLLREIKGNMQSLKDFVAETRESLALVVNTSHVIHAGVGTLSEKSDVIVANQKKTNVALGQFQKQAETISRQVQ